MLAGVVGEALNRDMHSGGPRLYYKVLASVSRINLLDELQNRGALTAGQCAEATGLHLNTAREHLTALVATGLVRSDPIPTGRRGRPQMLYRTASDAADPQRRFRLRGAQSRARRRGRATNLGSETEHRARAQLVILDDHMQQSGFEVAIDVAALRVTMYDCPFAELVRRHPQICRVHRALIQDALRLANGPIAAGVLRPLSSERECTLELTVEQSVAVADASGR